MRALNDLLTVVVLIRNEEHNLPACLENLKAFTHVVLVDSGSTDRSLEIAKAAGREVVQFHWNGRFPKKRNWFLQNYAFKTPWVLFLDADERVTPDWIDEVDRRLPQAEGTDAYICYYNNWFLDNLLRYGDAMRKTVLLRIGSGGYERVDEENWTGLDMEIHEHLQVKGKMGVIRARLEHHDLRSFENYCKKHDAYAVWEAKRCLAAKGRFDSLTFRQKLKYTLVGYWWFAPAYFLASYVFMLGFLDGRIGYLFATCKMRYFRNVRRNMRTTCASQAGA